MYRIIFSFLLGLIVILMSSFPSIVNADGRREGRTADRQRTGIGQQRLGLTNRTNRDLRNSRLLDRYRDNRYYNYGSYYGAYGYPGSAYYGTYGYPSSAYYGTYGYPAGASSAYYGTYGYPTSPYDYYGAYGSYGYNYPSYSAYSNYPGYSSPYGYPGYNPYYNPGMYNPNTVFVNPPSSLNYPTGYPLYSESYLY